ncbi:uncharacterized protein LY89DRAFT_687123 [Mollisia scopiformis]|uniref:Uncharacterized protein n=1 Tax=Mollisia scopiformis TaxID=149040 RepID=A0A194X0M2_MOLSC|nr:uncharacterized protein LY89DRAFT_687123 [Mollisia scopiformis]KUJ13748.1 hypothetical protein LY89DRAFT_687123 [Mollisia scopiformis]
MSTETDTSRPMSGEQATTRSPPDVSASTHIIALCGTTDIRGMASPDLDGWMVSDFFAWKGIFKGLGASQRWMTCLDPVNLANRYENQYPIGPYIQGDPHEDNRAIVLSRPQISSALEDLEVLPDTGTTTLRDAFLRCFRETYQAAGRSGGSVLLLITSHGDIEVSDGGLIIGLPEPSDVTTQLERSSLLTSEMLRDVINGLPPVRTTTFLTSCFSENWVITPNWAPHSDPVLAAAQKDEPSHSWDCTTAGRFSGGVFSTYVLQELLKEAKVIEESESMPSTQDFKSMESPQERTWKQWCDRVRSLMARHRRRGEFFGSLPVFTATNGLELFWTRSGYGLGRYLENWHKFPKLPKSQYANPEMDRKVTLDEVSQANIDAYKEFMDSQVGQASSGDARTGSWSGAAGPRLRSKTCDLARRYLASKPGLNTITANRWLHASSRSLLEGRLDHKELVNLENALSWRLYCTDEAQKMANNLNLNMVPIATWSWEDWSAKTIEPAGLENRRALFNKNFAVTKQRKLVTPPQGAQCGREWYKPAAYLAAAFSMEDKDPATGYSEYTASQVKVARKVARKQLKGSMNLRIACEGVRASRVKKRD